MSDSITCLIMLAAVAMATLAPLARAASLDPDRFIEGNQLRALVTDRTWYGWSVTGQYQWVEYYSPDGGAFYRDDKGFLAGTWWLRGEREICFDYPALSTFCFAAHETPSGQVAIYDLTDETLIHITTRIVSGDAERLRPVPLGVGDEVGQE